MHDHVFAVDVNTLQGWWLRSSNGFDWTTHTTPTRFFRAAEWDGDLYIASADRTSNGPAGIWRWIG